MILLIDNYDSFVFNLARYLQRLGQEVVVLRNDVLSPREIRQLSPQAIVLSPGPCTPREAGVCLDLVRVLAEDIPLLGVCLGHQVIAEALGGTIIRAPEPVHGRVSTVIHQQSPLFAGVPDKFAVCRYHSLVVDRAEFPAELRITAETPDGIIMALEHTSLPIAGVQFHPEATLSQFGYRILQNFLHLAGIACEADLERLSASEFPRSSPTEPELPLTPVTF